MFHVCVYWSCMLFFTNNYEKTTPKSYKSEKELYIDYTGSKPCAKELEQAKENSILARRSCS